MLQTKCPQAARLIQSPRALAEGWSKSVCEWGCTIAQHCMWSFYFCCHTVGVQRPPMPKCLFYRAEDMHRTLPWKRGIHKHTYTLTSIQSHAMGSTHFSAEHGSQILLSHSVLGQKQWFCRIATEFIIKGRKLNGWYTTAAKMINYLCKQFTQAWER